LCCEFFILLIYRFFKRELEIEMAGANDEHRRMLLYTEIRNCEQRIINLMRQDRERMERENRNMEMALAIIKKRED